MSCVCYFSLWILFLFILIQSDTAKSYVVVSIIFIQQKSVWRWFPMGLLPDTHVCGLRMRQECRERFPHHRLQTKPLSCDPGMHHGTCVTHVPWCMSGSLTRDDGNNVRGIPGACVTRKFAYLVRGPSGTIFKRIFVEWKLLCLNSNCTKVPYDIDRQYASISLGDGLAMNC